MRPENYQNRSYHWRDKFSIWYQHKNTNFPTQSTLDGVIVFYVCSDDRVQTGEMSKLGWLIGWSIRDIWADSLYFLHMVFGSICKTFVSFQHILRTSSYACWANFDFSGNSVQFSSVFRRVF
jgi:hypothetical protein